MVIVAPPRRWTLFGGRARIARLRARSRSRTVNVRLRRVVLVLLALLIAVPSVGWSATLYRCASGELRDHCCCAPKAPASGGDAQLRAGCCCQTVHLDAAPTTHAAPAAAFTPPAIAPALIAIAPPPMRVVPVADFVSIRSGADPPPLFLVHCALLR